MFHHNSDDISDTEALEREDLRFIMQESHGKRFLSRLLQDLRAFEQCATQEDVCLRNTAEILLQNMQAASPMKTLEIIALGRGIHEQHEQGEYKWVM